MAPQSAKEKEPASASNGNGRGAPPSGPAAARDKNKDDRDKEKEDPLPIGPQSGLSSIPTQYIQEQNLRQMLTTIGYNESQEDQYRLKGVQLIDSVRQVLQLPVKTFDTAATYYHKFRIRFPSDEYNYEDVALASLFVACKVEDTIKKSKEILCAAHNIRQTHDNKTPDDKVSPSLGQSLQQGPRLHGIPYGNAKTFEGPSKFTIGLERHILETIGFDFRVQYPQKLLIKMIRKMFPRENTDTETDARTFLRVAYDMSIDLYKTFAPIKQSTSTIVMAILELTALFLGAHLDKVQAVRDASWHTERGCVLETMLDLMDLYIQFSKSTKVGPRFELNKMMDIKIELNKSSSKDGYQRYYRWCESCAPDAPDRAVATPGSVPSPAANSSIPSSSVKRTPKTNERTLRFVFNAELAHKERELVAEYFKDEYEEYEVEVEEPIREPDPRQASRSGHPHRNHSSHHNDHGWGPYHRSRPGPHSDRHKGRKGGGHGYY